MPYLTYHLLVSDQQSLEHKSPQALCHKPLILQREQIIGSRLIIEIEVPNGSIHSTAIHQPRQMLALVKR